MTIHYAIGDIHGRDDLLEGLYRQIAADRDRHHAGTPAVLVHIGDYIDRGARSREVIDRVMGGLSGFTSVCLKGNHEQMMLDCLDTDDSYLWALWLQNGGEATLESFGVRFPHGCYDAKVLTEAVGPARLEWLHALRLTYVAEPYLFVHAGLVPGVPLSEQDEEDLLWIRGTFLDSREEHGFVVVHGHTPVTAPDVRANRINIDTGAVYRGGLTAVVLGEPEGPRFLSEQSVRGRGP